MFIKKQGAGWSIHFRVRGASVEHFWAIASPWCNCRAMTNLSGATSEWHLSGIYRCTILPHVECLSSEKSLCQPNQICQNSKQPGYTIPVDYSRFKFGASFACLGLCISHESRPLCWKSVEAHEQLFMYVAVAKDMNETIVYETYESNYSVSP